MMTGFSDDDSLQKYYKRLNVDQVNQQATEEMGKGMAGVTPAQNPYADSGEKKSGILGKIVSPVLKVGGMVATMLGQPEIGIPMSIAGGVASGADQGGLKGALGGAVKSGIGEAATYGLGTGLDMLKSPINDPIDIASKGLTVPGQRLNSIDLGNLTVPASPKALAGGS